MKKGEAIGTPFYKPGDKSFDLAIGSAVVNFTDKSEEHFKYRLASLNVPGNVAQAVGAAVPSAYKNAKNFEDNGKISEAPILSHSRTTRAANTMEVEMEAACTAVSLHQQLLLTLLL